MRSNFFLRWLGLLVLGLWAGCQPLSPIESVEWQPQWAAPWLDTELATGQIFERWVEQPEWLKIDADGLIRLVYPLTLYDSTLTDYLRVEDFEVPLPSMEGQLPTELFGLGPLSSATVRSGRIRFAVEMAQAGSYRLNLVLPNGVNERSEPLGFEVRFTGPSFELPAAEAFSLAGNRLDFVDGAIGYRYALTDAESGQPVSPQRLRLFFEGLHFAHAVGEFDLGTVVRDTLTMGLDLPDFQEGGHLELSQPALKLRLTHSLGVPLQARLDPFEATRGGEHLAVHSPLSEGVSLAYPSLSEIGQTRTTELTIDHDNSNFPALISLLPQAVTMGWQFGREGGDGSFFLTDSLHLRVAGSLEVPLLLQARDIGYVQPIERLPAWPELSGVETVALRVRTDNGLPLEVYSQVVFFDEGGRRIDSLFSEAPLLSAAAVDATGEVASPSRSEQEVVMDALRYASLRRSTSAELRLRVSTSQGGSRPVRLTTQQALRLQLGVRAQLSPSFD